MDFWLIVGGYLFTYIVRLFYVEKLRFNLLIYSERFLYRSMSEWRYLC